MISRLRGSTTLNCVVTAAALDGNNGLTEKLETAPFPDALIVRHYANLPLLLRLVACLKHIPSGLKIVALILIYVSAAFVSEASQGAYGTFVKNGVFTTTDASAVPAGLPLSGSWVGGDQFQGNGESAWRPARESLVLFVAGYPTLPGMSLRIEWRLKDGTVSSSTFDADHPREKWIPWSLVTPRGAVSVRWVAEDRSSSIAGWIGVSDFLDTRWRMKFASVKKRSICAFLAVGAIIGVFGVAVAGRVRRAIEPCGPGVGGILAAEFLTPIVATVLLALVGYLTFWLWFFSAKWGMIFGSLFLGAVFLLAVNELRRIKLSLALVAPWLIATSVGIFYLGLLLSPPVKAFGHAAANRFAAHLPADNEFPGIFATRLIEGKEPKQFLGDWLGSDRPPLQTGWDLIFWPCLKHLDIDPDTAMGIAGVWLQLAWIPCLWAVFQMLGLTRVSAGLATLSVAFLGFTLLNTIYVWPKLSSAAFTIVGVLMCFRIATKYDEKPYFIYSLAGLMLALGWLSHGASAFALIGLVPFVIINYRQWKGWMVLGMVFFAVGVPWVIYQKFYDPPANRLLKWHLAGSEPVDKRGVTETLVAKYRATGWHGALEARKINGKMQGQGDWTKLFDFDPTPKRRYHELAFYLRSSGLYLILGVFSWCMIGAVRRLRLGLDLSLCRQAFLWMTSTWIVWLALMFSPHATLAHQGSYVIPLILYALLLAGAVKVFSKLTWIISIAQLGYFLTIWAPVDDSYYKSLPVSLRPEGHSRVNP